ncbi:hypothetical protein GGF43_003090, partial [Coemansia sp. RSA 2618]
MRTDKVTAPQRTSSLSRLSKSTGDARMFYGSKEQRAQQDGSARQKRPVAQRIAQAASRVARALSTRKRRPTSDQHPNDAQYYHQHSEAEKPHTVQYRSDSQHQTPDAGQYATRSLSQRTPQTMAPTHPSRACEPGRTAGSQGRLGRRNPETTAPVDRDFVCSLDHARVRWYGRIYISQTTLCFAGVGFLLSSSSHSEYANPSLVSLPNSTMRAEWARSFQSIPPAAGHSCVPQHGRGPWRRMAVKIAFRDVTRVEKEVTLGFCPNALTVATKRRHYIFTNFVRRDRAFGVLAGRWQAVKHADAGPSAASRSFTNKEPAGPDASTSGVGKEPADPAASKLAAAGRAAEEHVDAVVSVQKLRRRPLSAAMYEQPCSTMDSVVGSQPRQLEKDSRVCQLEEDSRSCSLKEDSQVCHLEEGSQPCSAKDSHPWKQPRFAMLFLGYRRNRQHEPLDPIELGTHIIGAISRNT